MKKKCFKGIFTKCTVTALMVAEGLSLTACVGGSGDSGNTTAATTAQSNGDQSDKTLKIAELWAIDSINPFTEGSLLREKALVTESLVKMDSNLEIVPELAKSWEVVDDNTWRFTLRDDVKFHDGSSFNADAVVWSFEKAIENNPTLVTNSNIDKVTAEDDKTVVITTSSPNPNLLEFLRESNYNIVAESSFDKDGNLIEPIGTGPFKIKSFSETTSVLEVERNDDYYGNKAKLASMIITPITDSNTRSMAIESGEVDFTSDIPFNDIERLDSLENVKVESFDNRRVYICQMNSGGIFSDLKLRQAFSLGIDRDVISEKVLHGSGTPTRYTIADNMKFTDDNPDTQKYDPELAKKILSDAGWTDTDGDGYCDKDGKVLEFRFLTYPDRPGLPLIAEALQSQLKDIGMKVNVETMDFSAIKEIRDGGDDWGVIMQALSTGMASNKFPVNYYTLCSHFSADSLSPYGYSNTELQEKIEKIKSSFDDKEREKLAKEAQELILTELPEIAIANYGVAYGFNEKVTGYTYNPNAHDYYMTTDISMTD